MEAKKNNKAFFAVCSVIVAVLLVVALAASIVMPLLSSTMNTYLGRGDRYTVQIEGAENWNTKYYDQKYTDTDSETGSVSYGLQVSKLITDEGEVLLKNDGLLPIAKGTKVTPFGWRYLSPIYGGTGSGNVDASKDYIVTAERGLANFAVNDTVVKALKGANVIELTATGAAPINDSGESGTGFTGATTSLYEFDPSIYAGTEESCKDTVGIVYIGRVGGEGGSLQHTPYSDGTPHELALTSYEKEMLTFAKQNCQSVIAVIESSNVMELGELMEGGEYECNAIVWVGGAGATGFASLGDILCGDVNPSGRTADLWDRDLTKNPVYANFLPDRVYENTDGIMVEFMNYTNYVYFVELEEGIYTGYRYFETASDIGALDYDSAVVYPFGYGLSYTTFTQEITEFSDAGNEIKVTVQVTNTGAVAGKDVVQIYYTAPYTDYDKANKVEKSTVNLAAFDKTGILEPGKSETLTLSFLKEDMASYSYMHENTDGTMGCYLLEQGAYTISLRNNSHDVIDIRTVNIGSTIAYDNSNPRQSEKDAQSAWDENGESLNFPKAAHENPEAQYIAATNRYADSNEYMQTEATLLTRADWNGTQPTAPAEGKTLSAERLARGTNFDIENDPVLGNKVLASEYPAAPVSGQANGLSVSALRGLDYYDEAWDALLDQLEYNDELYNAFNWATFEIPALESIDLPNVVCHDGPQGWGMTGADGGPDTTAFATEVVVASTWNEELAYLYGDAIGQESLVIGFTGWYGPAMNLHRSAFNGRNFEYYSEDPLLNGKIGAACVSGAADNGVICFLKHFFANDYEGPACSLDTWADEQTLRELYAKPFEIAVKEAKMKVKYISDTEGTVSEKTVRGLTGMMMAANMINGEWCAANASVQGMLHDEWGFEGLTSTDMCLQASPNIVDKVLRSGTDLRMGTFWMQYVPGWVGQTNLNDPYSNVSKTELRRAMKNVAYAVANSNMMQGVAPGSITKYHTSPWVYGLIAGDAVAVLVSAVLVVLMVRRAKDAKKHPENHKK
ncbi:MAG: glycoside hydrolase family 3 C-terminal domain-containing protein [Lachnospiraceae bacterium]|nr:glycoside hydrolase family 3 C-terminal domain-containing protein [Lachnospiraceae bacterium]